MKNISSKNWIITFVICLVTVFLVFVGTVYFVDPLLFFRFEDGKRYLDPRFVSAGLIKNSNYDVAIVGSSMMQNFDGGYFEEMGWGKAVKFVPSGMTLNEGLLLLSNVFEVGKANRVVLNVDWSTFTTKNVLDMSTDKLPDYLYNDNRLDDLKYVLGYEAWTRFMPYNWMINNNDKLRAKNEMALWVDSVGDFSKEYEFSKAVMIEGYQTKKFPMTMYYEPSMEINMKKNIDEYVEKIMLMRGEEQIVFCLPPYSALWWNITRWDELYSTLTDIRLYFVEKVLSYDNVRIVDMQTCDEIINMENYKDYTHFSPMVQTLYADAIMDGSRDLNLDNYMNFERDMNKLLDVFIAENIEWLE